jgi:cob(I)alamin adenosyltransferase
MSVSTKSGDNKQTSTGSGRRVSKASPRIYIMGTADELCSIIGVAKAHTRDTELITNLERIQNLLMIFIAELADPAALKLMRKIQQKDLDFLEALGTQIEAKLPPINQFIIYGEDITSAHLDHARAVARRLERDAVGAPSDVEFSPVTLQILNRLSDTLYLLARNNSVQQKKPLVWVSYE